jgi:hypothetical protein
MSSEDVKQVELLSMFHYILGGITALFSCLPFLHLFMGIAMVTGKFFNDGKGTPPPDFFGWFFIVAGAVGIVLGWSLAVCMLLAGRKLKRHQSRTFCTVVAAIECVFMPFGTILGVFTLMALNKDSVRALFDDPGQQSPIQSPPSNAM